MSVRTLSLLFSDVLGDLPVGGKMSCVYEVGRGEGEIETRFKVDVSGVSMLLGPAKEEERLG
jgi:hypothetical protein